MEDKIVIGNSEFTEQQLVELMRMAELGLPGGSSRLGDLFKTILAEKQNLQEENQKLKAENRKLYAKVVQLSQRFRRY